MSSIARYFATVFDHAGQAWNDFWFTPASPRTLVRLRVGTGLLALLYFFSWNASLTRWFTPEGLLPAEAVEGLLRTLNPQHFHLSPLFFVQSPLELWAFHAAALACAALFTLGLFSRATGLLSLGFVLSYVHRAPMLVSPLESILVMLLLYLPLGPCGAAFSLDALRRGKPPLKADWTANLSLRLIQLHAAGLVLLIATSFLSSLAWWNGTALWVLESQTSMRPFDLSFVRNYPLFVNGWTHLFVLVNLFFPFLVWRRFSRPVVMGVMACTWLAMLLVTGQVLYVFALLLCVSSFWDDDVEQLLNSPSEAAAAVS